MYVKFKNWREKFTGGIVFLLISCCLVALHVQNCNSTHGLAILHFHYPHPAC